MTHVILSPFIFLIVCPLIFLAGFVDSIAGGGGIISLPAYLFAGLPIHNALATNKLSSFCGTSMSAGVYLRNKCYEKRLVLPTIAASLVGSAIGAQLALITSDRYLKNVLLIILPIVAVVVLFRRDTKKNNSHAARYKGEMSLQKLFLIAVIAAFFIGMYDGFYGPGCGTFLMIVFTGILDFDERIAAGNTKCINWASNAASLFTFITAGKVIWILGGVAAMCSIVGNFCGASLVIKNGKKYVRPLILVVLLLLFIKILSGK